MKHIPVFVFLFFVTASMQAQDTLFKKSKERILAYVIRVDTATVSYHKAAMPDGPIYSVAKGELIRIRYENGHIDSFVTAPVIKPEVLQQQNQVVYTSSSPNPQGQGLDRIEVSGRRYYQNNVHLTQKKVSRILVQQHNPKIEYYLHDSWRRQAMGQVASYGSIPFTAVGGFSLLFGLAVSASNAATTSTGGPGSGPAGTTSKPAISATPFYVVGFTSLVSAAALSVAGKIYKKSARASYLKAIEMYNAQIL
jgi:hypothetical protein